MAKCKHWNYCMLDADLRKSGKCRGKDPSCNIIPKKPKTKSVVIKGWINAIDVTVVPHRIEKDYHHRVYSDKKGALREAWAECITVPCTITYQVKGGRV